MNEKSRDSLGGFLAGLVVLFSVYLFIYISLISERDFQWSLIFIGIFIYLSVANLAIFKLIGFRTDRYQIIIRGLFIGVVFSVGALQFCTCSWAPSFGLYLVVLSFFHWSEYFVTAVTHESHATIDSYLLSHSNAYRIAALASWIEFFVEMWVFTDFKTSMFAYYCRIVGLCIVIIGEILRKGAMITARTNFNHYVRHVREDGHVLVTHGLYACFRHPAYVGWFYWSIGTQILLCNPICTLAYTLASWKFFDERIRTEEMTLLNFFGKDYTEYQKRVGTGLPFIKGYTLES